MHPRIIDIQPAHPWPCFGVEIDCFRLERGDRGWRLRVTARLDPRGTRLGQDRYRDEIGREAAAYFARVGLPVEAGQSVLAQCSLVDPRPISHASASYPVAAEIAARLDELSAHQLVALSAPGRGYTLRFEA